MSNNNLEIVHAGWLTKSPPSKPIWRARWRRRWFVLRHTGELPGQYYLEYYTDHNCRKLKGKIDLDQCNQVDAGLRFENSKQKYQHMFDVKTPKRIYYLAAESEEEMNKWVEYVCHVCGLKAYKDEEEDIDYSPPLEENTALEEMTPVGDSPPTSPTSTISGPYIPISECISGKPLSSPNGLKDFNNLVQNGVLRTPTIPDKRRSPARADFYDSPRKLQPPNLELKHTVGVNTPPLQSPATDAESVFTDDEWTVPVLPAPAVNWNTFPAETRPSDSSDVSADVGSWSVVKRFGRLTVVDSAPVTSIALVAPPRPPKPLHLVESPKAQHLLDPSSRSEPTSPHAVSDETYDFPRCHAHPLSRNCYSNAAPGQVFRYDFHDGDLFLDPASPHSESSSNIAIYSNLPSPLVVSQAPAVHRCLKPGRKTSDSASLNSEPSPGGPFTAPPDVDRKLKPQRKLNELEQGPIKLASPPGGHRSLRKNRAAPSPTPKLHHENSSSDDERRVPVDNEEIYFYQNNNMQFIPAHNKTFEGIQYLDLDLECATASGSANNTTTTSATVQSLTTTVYKTVDFIKTEAFNRTRQEVEEGRKQCAADL
uniref:(California timema) hypothetical protein n=1 Tax=Timema californicum TaxID=61474 RepID=A0A7R9IX59_TIMCA|nr:unnamed protein product [Timema californicum]